MSSNKPPPNPFGSGERTVIVRPNPAGRGQPSPPPQAVPQPPPADIWGTGNVTPAPPPRVAAQPQPSYQPPPNYQQPQAYAPPQPAPRQPMPSGPVMDLGFNAHPDVQGANPIMHAARPLLVLLANLRLTADHSRVAPLMDAIADEIGQVERALGQASIPPEHIRLTKYALCATADDIVQHLPGSDRLLWTQYSMLSRFFGVTTSGVGFFDELTRAKMQPTVNYNVLELMHACLSLGFQGQYRASGGEVALQQVRRDLFQTLRTLRPRPPEDISPHWRGQEIKPLHLQRRLPVWVTAAGAAALLACVFLGLRFMLGNSTEALANRLEDLHPTTEVRVERDVYKPLPPIEVVETGQLIRVKSKLAGDIKAARLTVEDFKGNILVKLKTDTLFAKGSADVRKDYAAVIDRVAAALDAEEKEISVVGHTDNVKLKSQVRFKDNQDLSEKRAKAVAAIMIPKLKDPTRIRIVGKGATEPVKSNDTEKNRALNRRVEIFLPKTGP